MSVQHTHRGFTVIARRVGGRYRHYVPRLDESFTTEEEAHAAIDELADQGLRPDDDEPAEYYGEPPIGVDERLEIISR